jgi:formyl-CoA transferase
VLPLKGITVVSVEHAVAAPFATRQLADLGARVIKVERPGGGDFARHYDTAVHGLSSYFVWLNRSKESVTADLKTPEGRDILHRLCDRADVVVQNLAVGAADRLGLSADELRAQDPRKVVLAITGWGSTGPWAQRKAYDLLVQCETGLVSLTGTPDEPARAGVSVADIAGGMYGFSAVLAALYRREVTGEGASIEVSLFEALAEWMGQPAAFTAATGVQQPRVGLRHATIAPYGVFTAADGRPVLVSVQNADEWERFCVDFLGDVALVSDPRFATNPARVAHREQLEALIAKRFAELDQPTATALLDRIRVASAGVNTVEQLLSHPVLEARGRWRDVETPGGAARALLPPVDVAGVSPRMGPVPDVGEHTESVLGELGLSDGEIDDLRARGVV